MTKPASRWLVIGAGRMLGREMDVGARILNDRGWEEGSSMFYLIMKLIRKLRGRKPS